MERTSSGRAPRATGLPSEREAATEIGQPGSRPRPPWIGAGAPAWTVGGEAGRRPGTSASSRSSCLPKIQTWTFREPQPTWSPGSSSTPERRFEWGGVVHRNTDHPHATHHRARPATPSGEPLTETSPEPDSARTARGRPKLADTAARPANHRRHRASEAGRAYRKPGHALGPQAGRSSDSIRRGPGIQRCGSRSKRGGSGPAPAPQRAWPSRNHTPETVGLSDPISSRSSNR
jgi:hypothetical protein